MRSSLSLDNNGVTAKYVTLMIVRIMAATILIGLLAFAGCKSDEESLETDRVKKLLTDNTWTIERVTVDGVDKTASFAELTLHFTNTHYTTTHGGLLWPESDNWIFTDDTGKTIVRSDDIEMTIREISNDKLVLAFTWTSTTLGPGRIVSTAGEHVFMFGR